LHLLRARLGRRPDGDHAAARRALDEGLHLARQSGLGLYLIDLLCEQAQAALGDGNLAGAEGTAREAWLLARVPQCQFVWGETQAGHLLGQALAGQGRAREARALLGQVLEARQRVGDPLARQTEALLARI
jgi:hypothetical protein